MNNKKLVRILFGFIPAFITLTSYNLALAQEAATASFGAADRPAFLSELQVSNEPCLVIMATFYYEAPPYPLGSSSQNDFFLKFFQNKANPPSIHDYFERVSYGKLNLFPATEADGESPNGIVGWYNLAHSVQWYKDTYNDDILRWPLFAAIDAVRMASESGQINLANYDSNHNGVLEPNELHLFVIFAAYEDTESYCPALPELCWQPRVHRLWFPVTHIYPHGYRLNGLSITSIALAGEMQRGEGELNWDRIRMGPIAHEMGHDLGLWEHYNSPNSAGTWCLMGSGDNAGGGDYPSFPCAYERWLAGWQNTVEVTSPISAVMPAAESSAEAFLIPEIEGSRDRFYLIENRQQPTGNDFDQGIPGSGMLIWDIDKSNPDRSQKARLVQADNNNIVGESGDPFPGSSINRKFDCSPPEPLALNVFVRNISDPGLTMTADMGPEPPSQFSCSANPSSMLADGVSTSTISAILKNNCGNQVVNDGRSVTFSIVSGSEHGHLLEPTIVMSSGGIATCQLQAGGVPGDIQVQVSSSGMSPCTTLVGISGTFVCGNIYSNTTWTLAGSPYIVTCNIVVSNYSTLTIEAGVTVKFVSNTGLKIGVGGSNPGQLRAVGTEERPITFTSVSGKSGDWDGIFFESASGYNGSTSILEHCIVEKAGQEDWGSNANVYCNQTSQPTMRQTIVRGSSGRGVYLYGSPVTIVTCPRS